MAYLVPVIEGKIEKITIFPPVKSIEIIDIHRLMMKKDVLPATIMRAQTEEMRLLRDISLTLVVLHISKDDKMQYIAEYFKLSSQEVDVILSETITTKHKDLLSYQELLKDAVSLKIAWDVEKNCQLSFERAEELRKNTIKEMYKYEWFSPSYMRYKKEV
ncbi:hypothetical protein JHD47_08295 [Sulfurimonas sp. SAG-AH-194-L11]|nr:hypothetical protein [Sulfurimonas sp. SAG-AH-194-L11]MDF1877813.1 hypothetical protein [Sulfurimonas sp. SAG-AH-194-L11]